MKKFLLHREMHVLMFVLFCLTLSINLVLFLQGEKRMVKEIENRYLMNHYIAQKMILPSLHKEEHATALKKAERMFEVKIKNVMQYHDQKQLAKTYNKTELKEFNDTFKKNQIVEYIGKDKKEQFNFYQYIPMNQGKDGYIEIVYDAKEFKKELKEKKTQFLNQNIQIIVAEGILFFVILFLIPVRKEKGMEKEKKEE